MWASILALAVFVAGRLSAQEGGALSPQAAAQIQALLAEKASRTAAQKKIDSQLVYAAKMAAGQAIAQGVATLEVDIPMHEGLAAVDVRGKVTPALEQAIRDAGGSVQRTFPKDSTIDALLPLSAIEKIAGREDVRFVSPQSRAQLNPTKRSVRGSEVASVDTDLPRLPSEKAARLKRFRETLERAVFEWGERNGSPAYGSSAGVEPHVTGIARPLIGSRNSQGDVTHRADVARATFGVNGAGLRIGVLSDSFNNLGAAGADVTLGDLPGPGNPNGFTTPVGLAGSGDEPSGGSDEGRAMLQIVHDVAPGAELFFATAFNSITDFANNIRALRGISAAPGPFGNVTPGCDIIIDDIFYFVESGLHDGQAPPVVSTQNCGAVTQAVNDVTADGALYFSSAGNSGSVTQATAGAWEGDFVSAGASGVVAGGNVLDWDQSGGTSQLNNIVASSGPITMHWSDPLGGSTNDYDLFRLNTAGTAISASSTNLQTGTQDPFEQVSTAASGKLVVLQKTGGADRFISLSSNRGRLQFATTGQTRGHSGAAAAFGVAATPAAATFGPPTPNGPFPGTFTTANQVEPFNSDGPRRTFFQPDGTPHTPGNFSSTGGVLRQKPDCTAADGVDTTLPAGSGLNPFYGTSAAAPHAGAIAALVKNAAPSATPAQLRTFLLTGATDIMAAGTDRDSGVGIIDAFAAVQATGATGVATLALGTLALTETSGNFNGSLEPGEAATLNIPLRNLGVVNATGVAAVLSTSTPGVTITSAASAYPDIASGGGVQSPNTIYAFSVSGSAPCPSTIAFVLTVTYTGGPSPRTFNVPVNVGPPGITISGSMTTSPTLPGGVVGATSTGTQTGRLVRNGVASSCAGKAYPGTNDTSNRRFQAYTFTTPTNTNVSSYCVTATFTAPGATTATAVHPVAYLAPYTPVNIVTNYAGDPGSSPLNAGVVTFSFNVPAGRTFTIVVHDIATAAVHNQAYTLTLSGLCGTVAAPDPIQGTVAATEVPANSDSDTFLETCEEIQVSLPIVNAGTASATGVSASITTSTPGVVLTNASSSYPDIAAGATQSPATPFRFRILGCVACGATVNLTATVNAAGIAPVTLNIPIATGGPATVPVLTENFDGATVPALPAGWTAAVGGPGNPAAWGTTTTTPDTAPNAAFTNAPTTGPDLTSTNDLVSPVVAMPVAGAVLSFRQTRNFENGFDGGVLEVSVGGGPFVDVTHPSVGGVFTAGGYNATISTAFTSPIAGRAAWSGAQATYVTSTVALPATLGGQNVQFRWRAAWDDAVVNANPNWRIDTIALNARSCSTTASCLPSTTNPSPTSVNCAGSASFSVTASAAVTPIYQWRKGTTPLSNGGSISGANGPTLTINPVVSADAGNYNCVVTEATCAQTSADAALTVNPDATPPTVTPPANLTIAASTCGPTGIPRPQGLTSGTSATFAAFLTAATATDACGTPTMLTPQVGGVDVTPTTFFPIGTTTVTFRAQDGATLVGTATATVTVRAWGDLNEDGVVDARDLAIFSAFLGGRLTPQGAGSPWIAPATMGNVTTPGGTPDAADYAMLRNYLVGNVSCLPN